jgi:hypothetical protein
MRNTSAAKLVSVIAKLVRRPVRELVQDNFLSGMDSIPIHHYRSGHLVRIVGRKWLAPLYRPVLSTFVIRPGTFVAVRINGKASVDLEYVDASGESTTYTVKGQEWREKEPYFTLMPPERFRGSLGEVVELIMKTRKGQKYAGQ